MVNWSRAWLSIGIRCYRTSNYSTCRRVGLNPEFSADHPGAIAHNAEPHSFFLNARRTEADPVVAHTQRTGTVGRIECDHYRFCVSVLQGIANRLLRDPK